jgi:hypothetical protein
MSHHSGKDPTKSNNMSVADTGKKLPAIAEGSVIEFAPKNSWLAAEARRRERARRQTDPNRSELLTRKGRRLASGTAYLSVPTREDLSADSRADTVEDLRSIGEADAENILVTFRE